MRLMAGRRGQILGFDTREGWDGWDVVRVQMPEGEIGDLIVEVRSATAGVGQLHVQIRSHGGTHRPDRRPDRVGAEGCGSLDERFLDARSLSASFRGEARPTGVLPRSVVMDSGLAAPRRPE